MSGMVIVMVEMTVVDMVIAMVEEVMDILIMDTVMIKRKRKMILRRVTRVNLNPMTVTVATR